MKENKPLILIVDDSQDIVRSLSSFLEHNGFRVDVALNGSEALRKIQSSIFDIIICDIEMPGMTGLAFLERLRKTGRAQDVILMTGYLEPEYFIRAIRLGASDFVSKPIDTRQLLNSIRSIIEKNRSKESLEQLMANLDEAKLSFVINPSKFFQYGISKVCNRFLRQNLRIPENHMNEILVCVDEMVFNAFIHGTLELTREQRNSDHQSLQEIIAGKLNQPDIAARRIRFTLSISQAEDMISISVEDDGDGYDYMSWVRRVTQGDTLNLEENGRGLAMLFHLSDTLDFANGGRMVRISRKLNSRQTAGA
ncbi:MAG: response regulator [Candidatus Syntrophosphaera sp.]